MKDIIKKILKEDNQFKKSNYYRKVSEIIANNLVIDHKNHYIVLPFVSPWSNYNDYFFKDGMENYSIIYSDSYLNLPTFNDFIIQYGLKPQKGIIMVMIKLIEN